MVGAQKLSLAASVGTLSLMLRKAGEANAEYTAPHHAERSRHRDQPVAQERKGTDRRDDRDVRRGRRSSRNTACRSRARDARDRGRMPASRVARQAAIGDWEFVGRLIETRRDAGGWWRVDSEQQVDDGSRPMAAARGRCCCWRLLVAGAARWTARRAGAARLIQIGAAKRTATVQCLHRQVRGRAHRHELRRGHGRRSRDRGRQSADRPLALDPRQEERHHPGVGLCRRQEADRRVRRRGGLRHLAAADPRSAGASRMPSCGSRRSTAASCCPAPRPTGRPSTGGADRQAVRPGRHQYGAGARSRSRSCWRCASSRPPARPAASSACSGTCSASSISPTSATGRRPASFRSPTPAAAPFSQPGASIGSADPNVTPSRPVDDLADRGRGRAVRHRAVRLDGRPR